MDTVNFETLKPDLTFTGDLNIGTNFIVLPHTAPVTSELMTLLKDWGFSEFVCDGSLSLGGDIGLPQKSPEDDKPKQTEEAQNENLKKVLANSKTVKLGNSDKSRMEVVHSVYNEYMNYINTVYTHYVTHKKINQTELSDTVKDLIIFIRDNRRYMLRVTPSAEARNKNYLVTHSMRSTVLAITIGLQQHMPLSKLIELGMACILHEIGMIRLPPQLYMSDRKLTAGEKSHMMTHPLLGYNILKDLDFPVSIQLGVLEHHEKENGSGYPRQLTSEKIISYAKVIAVACTFEAITAPRSYKENRSTFEAMVEMLKNENKQYDDNVIKALLYSVSLFPIGAYVFLKNGKVALVTDVNPDNPKLPIVQLLTEKEKDGSPKTIQTNDSDMAIVRVLSKKETEDVKASLEATAINEPEPEPQIQEEPSQQAEEPAAESVATAETSAPAASDNVEDSVISVDKDGTEEIDISFFG